jgi:hypothetical protein
MSLALILILIVVLIGVLPNWPHSATWGYTPSGILGVVLLIIILLALVGRI